MWLRLLDVGNKFKQFILIVIIVFSACFLCPQVAKESVFKLLGGCEVTDVFGCSVQDDTDRWEWARIHIL